MQGTKCRGDGYMHPITCAHRPPWHPYSFYSDPWPVYKFSIVHFILSTYLVPHLLLTYIKWIRCPRWLSKMEDTSLSTPKATRYWIYLVGMATQLSVSIITGVKTNRFSYRRSRSCDTSWQFVPCSGMSAARTVDLPSEMSPRVNTFLSRATLVILWKWSRMT